MLNGKELNSHYIILYKNSLSLIYKSEKKLNYNMEKISKYIFLKTKKQNQK